MVESAQSALTDAITVNALNRNKSIFATEDLLAASEALKSKASEVDSNLHGLYLGFGALEIDNQKLYDFLSTESVRLQVFAPNATTFTPPMRNYTATPWDAVRLWARYSRRLSGIVVSAGRHLPHLQPLVFLLLRACQCASALNLAALPSLLGPPPEL